MSTRIVCPNCHTVYNATDDQRGRRVRCKKCQAIFHAAGPEDAADLQAADKDGKSKKPAGVSSAPSSEGRGPPKEVGTSKGPRRQKSSRKIPALALLLIIGGVGGSLLIVAASAVFCVWLWVNPPDTWWASKHHEAQVPLAGGPLFAVPMPKVGVNEAADGDGKEAAQQEADAPPPSPPPSTELYFASPLPKDADPGPPAQGPANPQLPPDLVQKVKKATVYLRATLADGSLAQGSGFFGVEPNIVLTNAHVVGMLRAESRPPQKVEVVLNSGAVDERRLAANVLGVDRGADLAVLRVEGPELPPPLPVRSARSLQLTQQVYVFGFPFGADLGKEITVSPSSVSSLRWENDMLAKVQVNGGMQPGNSGGPVVDAYGNVIGVAVSVLRFTQINFAVPGDQVYAVLHGRIARLSLGQPYRNDARVSVSATVTTIDPLAMIRAPALEVWTGDRTPPTRASSTMQPVQQPGDSPHQEQALKFNSQNAWGDIVLPALPPGKAYWVQPKWKNPAGETQWATANVYPLPPPVERKAAQLMFRHHIGSRPLVLNSWLAFKGPGRDGREHVGTANAQTVLTETTEAVDAQELASVHLQYQAYSLNLREDNQDVPAPAALKQARQLVRSLAANLRIDKQGNLVGNEVDLSRVPVASQPVLANLNEEVERTLEGLAVPLPNKQVSPGETWKANKTLRIPTLGWSGGAHLDMVYTYLGKRERAGREEAVLEVQGKIRALVHQAERGSGDVEGVATVDLSSGQQTQVDLIIVFDGESNQPVHAPASSGKLTLRLRRDLPAGEAQN
jgi:predicted Zn finger-like uncharacterized protein